MTAFQPGDRVHLKGHAHVSSATGTVTGMGRNGDPIVRWDDNHTTTPHHPQHLEPAGEPMDTFKSIAPGSKATIEVAGVDGNVTVYVHQNIGAIDLDAADAPALALAILEAAGWPEEAKTSVTRTILHDLRFVVECAEKDAKEAADRETLEAETLALLNAHRMEAGRPAATSLDDYSIEGDRWRAVARTARTMHGVTK